MNEINGTFIYRQAALDLTLYLGKMYPREMKKIIKMTKTKEVSLSMEEASEEEEDEDDISWEHK